jgi:GT2 family glycosyltransferase
LAEIVAGRESTDWRGTCRKGENGCWCMYACVAPNNLRYQDLPLMPLGTEGGPLRRRWSKRLASFDSAPAAGELPAPVEAAADSTMPRWPVVSIVVASYNGGDFLDRNLESLLALDYPPDRRQIVLVDDASDDGSVDRAEARFAEAIDRGELRIVRNKRSLGVPGAYNRGVRASRPEAGYVLKSDNDVLPEPDALKQLVAAAEANPRAGIVGGRIYYHEDRERLQFVGGRLDSITRGPALIGTPPELLRDPAGSPSRWMDVVNSCLALIRRRVFEHAGLFPEFYGRYEYEDYEFTFNARQLGYGALYCPRAVGYHAVSLTSDANDLTTLRLRQRARNGVIFMARCAPRGWLAGFLTYQLAKIPFDFLRHGHPPGTLISGYLEGIRRVRQGGFTTEHLPPPPAPEPRSDLHVVNASGL